MTKTAKEYRELYKSLETPEKAEARKAKAREYAAAKRRAAWKPEKPRSTLTEEEKRLRYNEYMRSYLWKKNKSPEYNFMQRCNDRWKEVKKKWWSIIINDRSLSTKSFYKIMRKQDFKCALTWESLYDEHTNTFHYNIDHIIPLCKWWIHWESNIWFVTEKSNKYKWVMDIKEYVDFIKSWKSKEELAMESKKIAAKKRRDKQKLIKLQSVKWQW